MKYVPSQTVGQLSGSAGSTTASRNRNGSYFRNRTMPVNPNTTIQALQRTIFATYSLGWRNLSDAQRGGWESLGAQMTRTDSLGQQQTLTGIQAYISINRNLTMIGGTILSTAPTLASPANLLTVTVTATSV